MLPYPPQEMFDFQLFNQVVGQSITELLHPFGQVPVLIGGTSGEAATFMKYRFDHLNKSQLPTLPPQGLLSSTRADAGSER